MRIMLVGCLMTLLASAGTSSADEILPQPGMKAQAPSGPLGLGSADEEEMNGRLIFGMMFSTSHSLLVVKGQATQQVPIQVFVRVCPFTFLYLSYWNKQFESGQAKDTSGIP